MKYTTTVTQKGQATIPAPIRKHLGLQRNSKVTFEIVDEKQAIIKPVLDFFSLKGSLPSGKPIDDKAMNQAILEGVRKDYAKKFG